MKKVFALFLILMKPLFAETASDEVQAKLNAIRSMSATFTQVVKAGNRELSNSYGVMALNRPGRFRWETKSPLAQLVVADSKKIWIYDVDLEQVSVKKQEKGIGGTPALFLSGYDNTVARDFNVSKAEKGKLSVFTMKAKSSKENYQQVILSFNNDVLSLIEFYDQLGQHTVIRLTKVKNNPVLATDLFHFKPPKGVDVVQQ